jgi:hypothetical protein
VDLEVDATVWPENVDRDGDVGGAFKAYQLGVAVCPGHSLGRIRLAACLGGFAGRFTAQGLGLPETRLEKRLWAGAFAHLRAAVRLVGPLGLRVDVGAVVPVTRDRYTLVPSDGEEILVHRAKPVVFTSSIGLELRVP